MTVHGAKGLQAPVVILPDTGSVPKGRDKIVWSEDETIPFFVPPTAMRCAAIDRLIQSKLDAENEEYNRLLYVALTRAEDRLVVCGWRNKQAVPDGCWYRLVEDGFGRIAPQRSEFDLWPGEILWSETPQRAEAALTGSAGLSLVPGGLPWEWQFGNYASAIRETGSTPWMGFVDALANSIVVTILVLVGLREAIMNAVPASLKRAIGAGIGLFILFIGAVDGGLIRQPAGDGPVPVEFVFPTDPAQYLTVLGIFVTFALFARKVPAALLVSIVVMTVISIVTGVAPMPALEASISFGTLGQFDLTESFTKLGVLAAALTVFSLMLTDFFDTMGTATAIAEEANLVKEDGTIPNIGRILLVDSVAAIAGGSSQSVPIP